MSIIIQIQPNIFCENCKECGARPVIEQIKDKFIVTCPNDKKHYKTKPGLINVDDWNLKNRIQKPLIMTSIPAQKAS